MSGDRLDCNTPRGRAAIAAQRVLVQRFADAYRLRGLCTTDSGDLADSPVDALFYRGDRLHGVAEVKDRDLTLASLRAFGSYLITYRKLTDGIALATSLRVPFLLIVGLTSGEVVWWKVAERTGRWAITPKVDRTPTRATCNGGTAIRVNAYLPLDRMVVLLPPSPPPVRGPMAIIDVDPADYPTDPDEIMRGIGRAAFGIVYDEDRKGRP